MIIFLLIQVPEYYEVIKNPIDLTTVKTKLQTINYDSVYDFVVDMKLLFDNCYQFNPVSKCSNMSAMRFEDKFKFPCLAAISI
jgi:hypothetical protein